MPEGHTIHRLARDLASTLGIDPLQVTSPQGRFADGAADLDGRSLVRADAWGKHLFLDFDGPRLHVHLGLIGKFRRPRGDGPIPDSVRLRIDNGDTAWHLTGPQTCRLVDPGEVSEITDKLGPDPLRRGARPDRFVEALGRRRAPIAAALLDQNIIAGIGNVYRAEFLFIEGIDPVTPAANLRPDQALALWDLAKAQLRQGVRLNRIVTVSADDAGSPPGRLRRADALYVYKREGRPCRRCATEITIGQVGGRSCWWCPSCQS